MFISFSTCHEVLPIEGDTKECFLYLLSRGGEIRAFLDDSVYNVPNIYSIYVLIGYNPVCLIIKNKRL